MTTSRRHDRRLVARHRHRPAERDTRDQRRRGDPWVTRVTKLDDRWLPGGREVPDYATGRTSSLIVPGEELVERRVHGHVLNDVLTWKTAP